MRPGLSARKGQTMKIALINEFSQAPKNALILSELKEVAEPLGHIVVNTGMHQTDVATGNPADYPADNPCVTYVMTGIQASLLLNSGAVDFVVTGCGTGQGALLSCNSFPGVVCGYCVEPADAYLFLQINAGNALSIPYAKGFGWGADVNLRNIFTAAFSSPVGQGYPAERREQQNRNAGILDGLKNAVAKELPDAIHAIDSDMVRQALTPAFQEVFFAGCKDEALEALVREYVG